MNKTLIAIVGPTASGKTELAITVAKKYQTEILSADSRQFYSELNIGVARPNESQLAAVKHHFIACRSVTNEYNAGEFEADALRCLDAIFKKHPVAVLVGGSGLYIRAVCEGLDSVPPGDELVRKQLISELEEKGLKHLQNELQKADPDYFQSADIQNPRRVLRALEVCRFSGKPFSSFHTTKERKRDFETIKIGLTLERNMLYERIDQRVNAMMKNGLPEEAKALLPLRNCKALQSVGYSELFDFFDGKISLQQATELIQQHTRNFAKRQWTWFRKEQDVQWFQPDNEVAILAHIHSLLN